VLDVIIRNGRIIDGTGSPWFAGDIAVDSGRIIAVGNLGTVKARKVIDAKSLVVCPGFINVHNHGEVPLLCDKGFVPELRQGVTSLLVGVCGIGLAPVTKEHTQDLRESMGVFYGNEMPDFEWASLREFVDLASGSAVNCGSFIPHGVVRIAAMGLEDGEPSATQLDTMVSLVREEMQAGALGLSSGLQYSPACFSNTAELLALCKEVARYGGVYATHVRDYQIGIEDALTEAVTIARGSGVTLHISHYAASGSNRNRADWLISQIERMRNEGIDVTFDSYPYDGGCGPLTGLMPTHLHRSGLTGLLKALECDSVRHDLLNQCRIGRTEWDKVIIGDLMTKKNRNLIGKTISDGARLRGQSVADFISSVLIEEQGSITIVNRMGSEEGLRQIMRHPAQMFGSDSLLPNRIHPRANGTFARVLGKYVRQEGILSLENAIRKMTSYPALRFGIFDRGILRPGMVADVVGFDPKTIIDRATYVDPKLTAEGVDFVLVNGEIALINGEPTGRLSGQALVRES